MVSRSAVLGALPAFQDSWVMREENQDIGDITRWILKGHKLYAADYDKISELFLGRDVRQTAENIFKFLKRNVPYYMEGVDDQTVRSPAAIMDMPGDCKSYALFANGILDSLNRKNLLRVPIAYRFATYRGLFGKENKHVFSVVYPGTANEIWIDPVLDEFDERKQPSYYKDKIIKPMALYTVSGTGDQLLSYDQSLEVIRNYRDDMENERYNFIAQGKMQMLSPQDQKYVENINYLNNALGEGMISGQISGKVDAGQIITLGSQIWAAFGGGGSSNGSDPSAQSDAWNKLDAKRGHQFAASAADVVKNVRADIPVSALVRWILSNGIQGILANTEYGPITKTDIIDFFVKKGQPLNAEQQVAMGLSTGSGSTSPILVSTHHNAGDLVVDDGNGIVFDSKTMYWSPEGERWIAAGENYSSSKDYTTIAVVAAVIVVGVALSKSKKRKR